MTQPEKNSFFLKFLGREEFPREKERKARSEEQGKNARYFRIEELNNLVEERINKIMYQSEGLPPGTQPQKQRDAAGKKREEKKVKTSQTPDAKSKTSGQSVDSQLSEYSYDKVLRLCRTKLEDLQNHREKLLETAKVTLRMSQVPSVEKTSHNTACVKSEVHKRVGKVRSYLMQKAWDEPSKSHINEILKGHAQKMSIHSMKSPEEPPKVKPSQKEPETPKGSSSRFQKVIEIEKRENVEKKEVNEKKELIEKKESTGKKELIEKKESTGKKELIEKKESTGKKELIEKKESTGKKELTEKKEEATEKAFPVEDAEKKVTYTDRLVSERCKEIVKTPGVIIATAIEKFNSPFEEKRAVLEFQEKAKLEEVVILPKSLPVRTPSQVILLNSMIGKHALSNLSSKEASKASDPVIKTKRSGSADLKDLVAQAIKDHKIFCIFDNHWYIVRPVREELLNRGWVEVIPDRRLIPRRKPPPAGPTLDRHPSTDYTMEAMLTAREFFADDDDKDTVVKYVPKMERAKIPRPRSSDESFREKISEFRIVPPSHEKKRNNAEIREFVVKHKSDGKQGKEKGKKNDEGNIQDILDSILESKKLLQSQEKAPEPETDEKKDKEKLNLTEAESKMASKIIQSSNARINFMWLSIKPAIHLKCFNYSPEMVNKFQKTTFCTKIGLWSHLNNLQWYAHEVTFPAKSPRMYNTGEADDLQAFFQDFQMTACIGILKWLSETFFDKGIKGVQKKKGKVPVKAFEFAIRQCERYIRFRDNEDLNALDEPKVMQDEWNTFLQWFYIITNDHGKVQETSNAQIVVIYTKAVETLRAMKPYWPDIEVDGRLNIWIMKPYCASCGRGIFMTNNVYYIGQHSKYIVQKYIEKPLLIYNTKFDIRQWFMITKLVPLEIWMYKECYLRFCTQPFALRNLHESVHLSNNSVQRKYVNHRDPNLPDQNMWDSNTFQQYLKTIGHQNAWSEIIYPGMRDAIISIMLSAQDTFDSQRKSWFEVYGADFMISSNLKDGPWLIEINENPAMDPSTKVTARLCPQMLRDVIKVVVDKRTNKNALTGQWELVYRQNYSPSFGMIDIDVKGKRIARTTQSMKTGYSSGSLIQPPFFLDSKTSSVKKEVKEYEIVKSYLNKNKDVGETDGERHLRPKTNLWRNQRKAKLTKDTGSSSFSGKF